MKLHQLVSGIASGYVTKGIQLIVSVLLVPFFLSEAVLGLDGYGRAFTISAVIGFLPLFTEGLSFALVRDVSRAIDDPAAGSVSQILGAGIKILGVSCLTAAAGTLALSPILLPLVGLATTPDLVTALGLAALLYCIENLSQLARVPLVSRGAITFVNGIWATEAVVRAVAYLAAFTLTTATLPAYFGIQVFFAALRTVGLWYRIRSEWPDDVRGAWRARWTIGRASMAQSWPMATQVGCEMLVLRIPIVLANRLLGDEASGLLALAAHTIRLYVLQSLYAVLAPIAVPLASRLDPRRLSPVRLALLWRLEAVYVFVSGMIVAITIVCLPELIGVWLGPAYQGVTLPAQGMLLACAFEIAFNGRTSILIGQDLLGAAIPGIVVAGIASLCVAAVSIAGSASWRLAVIGVGVYFPLTACLGITYAFRRRILAAVSERPQSRPVLFLIAVGLVAWLLSPQGADERIAALALRLVVVAAAVVAAAHFLLIPVQHTIEAVRTLRGSLHRNVLAEPAGSGVPPTP